MSLAFSVKSLFIQQLNFSFRRIKDFGLLKQKNIKQSLIKTNTEKLINLKYEQQALLSQIETKKFQLSSLFSEVQKETVFIKEIKENISEKEKFYSELLEKTNIHLSQLDSYTKKSSNTQQKLIQETQSLQEKILKQEEFFQAANKKLSQLIEKNENLVQENQIIGQKNNYIQSCIKKIHENYSLLSEEKIKASNTENDSKQELNSLINTCKVLGDEILLAKNTLKAKKSEFFLIKDEYLKNKEIVEEIHKEIEFFQENEINLNEKILELEQNIENEYESKESKIQECAEEILLLKQEISKSREEIEN